MNLQSPDTTIPLPRFLKVLTEGNVPMNQSMAVAGKLYKQFNTASKLQQLDEAKMIGAGISDKDTRRLIMAAVRKAGYIRDTRRKHSTATESNATAGPSTPTAVDIVTTPPKKRKRVAASKDKNEFLPSGPLDEAATYGSLDFNEILDEQALRGKSVVVNRAPVMTAWATIVAERMGFKREEALSIASVYTEMNALSKGVSIGIFEKGKDVGTDADRNGSQPYVDFIGRRVPLYETQDGQWRAILNGSPAKPSTAFGYISRSFRQTTPHIFGSLRLLAESYGPQEINGKAWALYAEFRPSVDGWGKKSQVNCEAILALRKKQEATPHTPTDEGSDVKANIVQYTSKNPMEEAAPTKADDETEEPEMKRARNMSLEEYEAMLDQDTTFDSISLDFGNH